MSHANLSASNAIDFKPMDFFNCPTLESLRAQFGDEEACIGALFRAKWPTGYRCPRCSYMRYYPIHRRRLPLFECAACAHQTSLLVGTIFEKSRTSLAVWFQALYLHARDTGISAIRLMEVIGTTYKTAWLIGHKIRHAMMQYDAQTRIRGNVHVNGAQYGRPHNPTIYRHPQEHPLLIAASLEADGQFHHLKIKQMTAEYLRENAVTPSGLHAFLREHIDTENSTVTSVTLKYSPHRNRQLLALSRRAANGINAVYCGIGPKHLQAYLDQYCYTFNRRQQEDPAFSHLLLQCAATPTITYAALRSKPDNDAKKRSSSVWHRVRAPRASASTG